MQKAPCVNHLQKNRQRIFIGKKHYCFCDLRNLREKKINEPKYSLLH